MTEIFSKLPECKIDAALQESAPNLQFNYDQFRSGMALVGLPEATVDSLLVRFRATRPADDGLVKYVDWGHILLIGANPKGNRNVVPSGSWQQIEPSRSRNINYGLALSASIMSDILLRHPDVNEQERIDPPSNNWLPKLGAEVLLILGAALGPETTNHLGLHIDPEILASLAGVAAAGTVDLASMLVIRQRRAASFSKRVRRERQTEITKRAVAFATTDEAISTFSGIVKLEF